MVRAHSIWLLKGSSGSSFAAFTVKHELLTALEKAHPEDRKDWKVVRVLDGEFGTVTEVGTADQFRIANE